MSKNSASEVLVSFIFSYFCLFIILSLSARLLFIVCQMLYLQKCCRNNFQLGIISSCKEDLRSAFFKSYGVPGF